MSSSHHSRYYPYMNEKKGGAQVQPQDKFVVRFPDGMRERIAAAAAASGRSMNAEIVHRLSESFELEETGEGVNAISKVMDNPELFRRLGKAFVSALAELETDASGQARSVGDTVKALKGKKAR